MAVGQFFLSWMGDSSDSLVFAFELTQSEGDFASLNVTIPNPGSGLLASGRPLDATFSYESASGTVELFAGRVVGIPQDIQDEVVKVTFLARPSDFDAQKLALAETLKIAPFWDPIFVDPSRATDPDFVLEARPQLWHIDRVTNVVSVSDIIEGEDGTIDFGNNVFKDTLHITYGSPPATSLNMKCELSWKQTGTGSVDLSDAIEQAFADGGYAARGFLATYTGGGLMSAWPKPNQNIGGGWKVGESSCVLSEIVPIGVFAFRSDSSGGGGGFRSNSQTVQLVTNPPDLGGTIDLGLSDETDGTGLGIFNDYSIPDKQVPSVQAGCTSPNFYGGSQQLSGSSSFLGGAATIGMQLWQLEATLTAAYDANRSRKETVTFTLNAGVQPVVTSTADTTLTVNLSTSQVDQPVDPGGAIPVGDLRRRSYMLTDRGHQTLEYLIVYARAHLLARARAVVIKFETTFDDAIALTLRHSATISDPRLPGGVATGKVTDLTFSLDSNDGKLVAQVTMKCTVGSGGSLSSLSSASDTYATSYSTGYTATTGGGTALVTADVQYQNYDSTTITDDGIDFFNITADQALLSLVVINPAKRQEYLMASVTFASSSNAMATLNENCTKIAMALRPVTNSNAFETAFPIVVSDLIIPKTIDLEAS